jgi:hypothetical protein
MKSTADKSTHSNSKSSIRHRSQFNYGEDVSPIAIKKKLDMSTTPTSNYDYDSIRNNELNSHNSKHRASSVNKSINNINDNHNQKLDYMVNNLNKYRDVNQS